MEKNDIREWFTEQDIRRVKVGGFDVDGVLRGKYVSLDKFWSALDKGFGFCDVIFGWDIADTLYDNGSLTGWRTGFPDLHARIDPSSARLLPYEPNTAGFLVDFCDDNGGPHPACGRGLLKSMIARAAKQGYRARLSAEFEFWVFRETPTSCADKHYRDLQPLSPGMYGYSWLREAQHAPWLHDLMDSAEQAGIRIEGLHTETGPGVYEAAIAHDEPLQAADQAALFKTLVKQVSARHGLMVTFMAKWHPELPGSSGHLHQSLWDLDMKVNRFADEQAADQLSTVARHYIGGQLAAMPELTAVCSPTINSYKRYVPGVWAPLNASWGFDNRTCALRVITSPGPKSVRVEYRQTAADINPYLAMAASMAAGLHGIENAVDPPAAIEGDATTQTGAALPTSLLQANQMFMASKLARSLLGEDFIEYYGRTRDWEIRQYGLSVSEWELQRYFEAV